MRKTLEILSCHHLTSPHNTPTTRRDDMGIRVQVRETKRVRLSDVSKMPLMTPDPADGHRVLPSRGGARALSLSRGSGPASSPPAQSSGIVGPVRVGK